jgi:hypothetical protein
MDYLRYRPTRARFGAHSAMLDYAAAVLSGSMVAPRRVRAYRAWRKPASPLAPGKAES